MTAESKCENVWETNAGLKAACWFVHNSHRCGYVAVPKGHPAYELGYDNEKLRDIEVHGGLTYASSGHNDGEKSYPAKGENMWWFGFDCAHLGDQIFGNVRPGDVLRSKRYVENECEDLASQISKMEMPK